MSLRRTVGQTFWAVVALAAAFAWGSGAARADDPHKRGGGQPAAAAKPALALPAPVPLAAIEALSTGASALGVMTANWAAAGPAPLANAARPGRKDMAIAE